MFVGDIVGKLDSDLPAVFMQLFSLAVSEFICLMRLKGLITLETEFWNGHVTCYIR